MSAAAAKNEVPFPESHHEPDRHRQSSFGPDETTGPEALVATSSQRRGCRASPAGSFDRPRVSYKCRRQGSGLVQIAWEGEAPAEPLGSAGASPSRQIFER